MLKIIINTALTSGASATIEGDSPQEVHNALAYLHNIGQLRATDVPRAAEDVRGDVPETAGDEPDDPVDAGAAAADAAAAAVEKPKTERKPRKPKAKSEAPAETKEKAKPAKGATKEDTAVAITLLANERGLAAAKELLEGFGIKRAGELKEDQYDAFVARIEELLDMGGEDEAGLV